MIEENTHRLFDKNHNEIRSAISEYLKDFIDNTDDSGLIHPEVMIYSSPIENFQKAGFYGAQLNLKERQVKKANSRFRQLLNRSLGRIRIPIKWIDIINNFLGSLASATGVGEALKELKDCIRDEIPE